MPPQATTVESIPSDPFGLVRDLQAQLFVAHQQIGELQAQLSARLTPEDERVLRDEVVTYKALNWRSCYQPQSVSLSSIILEARGALRGLAQE